MKAPDDDPDATLTGLRGVRPIPADDVGLPFAGTTPASPRPPPRERPPSAEDTVSPLGATTPASPRPPGDRGPSPASVPRRIGRFQILERAGKGAMGVVYAAYDPDLDRKVAIKLLLVDATASPEYADRLRREARAMAQVVHPNVVAVHDVGIHDGRPFIAMDFVAGADLRTHLRRTEPAWRTVLGLHVQAGRGLAAAHATGIVHRDFKPDNVLVATAADGETSVRVADFGLASATTAGLRSGDPFSITAGDDGTSTPVQSMSGAGTPAYMAPERWDGRPADSRSDQFSFCVALWEALAGRRPFEGETLGELVGAITSGRLPSVPERSDVPRWVWRAIERGLAADPDARHPSMRMLVAALEADPRRRRRAIAAASAAVLLGAAGIGGHFAAREHARRQCAAQAEAEVAAIWNDDRRGVLARAFERVPSSYAQDAWTSVRRTLDRYTVDLAAARGALCEAHDVDDRVPDELYALQSACLDLRAASVEIFAAQLEATDDRTIVVAPEAALSLPPVADCTDVRSLDQRPPLPDDPATRARVERLQRRILELRIGRMAGHTTDELPWAEAVVADAEALRHPPTYAEALVQLGSLQASAGNVDLGEATLSRAIDVASRANDAAFEAEAWLRLLWVAGRRHPERIDDLVRGAKAAIDRLADGGQKRASLETIQGSLDAHAGRYDRAIEHHEAALAIWESFSGDFDVEIARIHNNLGWAYHMMERTAEATEHYERSLELKQAALGSSNPQLATTLHNLGMLARQDKQLRTAREHLERARELIVDSVGAGHPRVASVLSELAAVHNDAGERERAAEAARRGLAILQARDDADEALLAELRTELRRAEARGASP